MEGALFFRLMGGGSKPSLAQALGPFVLFDTSDISSVFQDANGTIAVTGAGDPIGLVLDKSQMGGKSAAQYMAENAILDPLNCPGQHMTQATPALRPIYQADGSLLFGLSYEAIGLNFTSGAGPASMSCSLAVKTTDSSFVVVNSNSAPSNKRGHALSSGSSSASLSSGQIGSELFINNVDFGGFTRGEAHVGVADGEWKLFREHDGDLSSWSGLGFGDYAQNSFSFSGQIGPRIILVTPEIYDTNASVIDAWVVDGIDYTAPPIFDLGSTFALEGDSITSQNYSSNSTNAIGYANWFNALSYRIAPYDEANFFAVGGGDIVDVEDTKEAQIGTMTADTLCLMIGANNIPAITILQEMKDAWTSIKDYTLSLGKNLLAICLMPLTVNGGVALTTAQLAKLKDFNTWLETHDDPENGILVVNPYGSLVVSGTDNPDPAYFKNESGKLLHPNVEGAYLIAKSIWDRLKAQGYEQNTLPQNDSVTAITNTTGGTLSYNASGQVVDGFTLYGFGDNGVLRVGSVSADGQNLTFSNPNGGGSSSNYYVEALNSDTSFSAGDKVFAWAEITVHSAQYSDGPFVELKETADANMTYNGMNKAGNNTGYMPALDEKLLFATAPITLGVGHVELDFAIKGQLNADGQDANVDMTIHNVGITRIS